MKKFLGLLSFVIITLFSCEDNVEINIGKSQLIENQTNFQVEFDNQIYHADYVEASLLNGKMIIKATKTSTKEIIVLILNRDVVGDYTLSPNSDIGSVSYKKDTDDTFNTSPTAYAGRIDLNNIDTTELKLFGEFSFIGVRMIPLLDSDGNPVLDANNDPEYTEEIKHFTNGIFENINFSNTQEVDSNLEPDPEPTDNTFFMKLDGTEFVETTLFAEKLTVDGVEVIEIRATNNGSNHVFKLQIPADVVFGSTHTLQSTTTNPASESIATYRIIDSLQNYGAFSTGTTPPVLRIASHDTDTNRIVGTFDFSAENLGGGADTLEFTEGAFSVTYTE